MTFRPAARRAVRSFWRMTFERGACIVILAASPAIAVVTQTDSLPAIVLHDEHRVTGSTTVDTLVSTITPGQVRISHHNGDAIIDTAHDRFVILDPSTSTYRKMSLAVWEKSLRGATPTGSAAPDTLRFEPSGPEDRIAGYTCKHFHLYARRQIFPGEWEGVEQEIWVTVDFEMPAATLETYRRLQSNLDYIELDAPVVRPPGVVLRSVVRRRGEGRPADADADEVEMQETFAVQRRAAGRGEFEIPPRYAPADSGGSAGSSPPR